MTGRMLTGICAAIVGAAFICIAGVGAIVGTVAACSTNTNPTPTAIAAATDQPAELPTNGPGSGYDTEQRTNAATIVAVGAARSIPARGMVIAVATAIQESRLRNLGDLGAANDHDSLGLFQQRPSQGWGTPAQLTDPVYAANKFYDALLTVTNWEQLPLTQAAQAVQKSGFPDAYAKWEADATVLVGLTNGNLGVCSGNDGSDNGGGHPLPPDFALPANTPDQIRVAIYWALQQIGSPYSFGGTCTNPHGTDPAAQCDCSSLVQQAYRTAGVILPRVTTDQVHAGTAVAGNPQPGDLIFIPGSDGTMDQPGHVGLYIGQNLIVHAPHTGDFVKISLLSDWGSIAAIRRPVTWPA